MRNRLNIIGSRYGCLLVLKEVEQINTKRRWLCQCDCGNQVIVRQESLRSGNTQSCGCIKPINVSKANLHDLTGKKFGKLTVIGRKKGYKKWDILSPFWTCLCECGNTITTSSANLSSGNTKSCGCLKKKKPPLV